MEKVLVVGVNTRAVACSLARLGYKVYAADYFGVLDLKPCAHEYRSFLDQTPDHSCGRFTDTFQPEAIEKLASECIDMVDIIICLAGVSTENFPQDKVLGNYRVKDIDDKYRIHQKLKNKYQLPATFKVSSIGEVYEIVGNYPEKNFILKPRSGSGGYGIREFTGEDIDINQDFILQERIDGINLSASVLSTRNESKSIITSRQIIGDKNLYPKQPFAYCGNITPYTDKTINQELMATSEAIIQQLNLIGSCGVDYIQKNDELYILEVNPRLQGTMECAELSLDINMAEAHLAACQGNLLKVGPPGKFAVKLIAHAPERSQTGDLTFPKAYDLPNPGVIIEKGEPVATVINSGLIREDTVYTAKKLVQRIYGSLNPMI